MVSTEVIKFLIDTYRRAMDRANIDREKALEDMANAQFPMKSSDYLFSLTYANAQINTYKVVISELESLIED